MQRNQRSNCQHPPDHRKSKRVPEKHPFLLYWWCQSLWLCGSQQTVENSERGGNTRSPDLPLKKSVCRSAAAAAKSLQSCPTLCDSIDSSPPGFPSLGFSRQEHWSGLPFPSPVHESEKWKWSRSVVSDSSDPMDCSLPGSSIHGIF